MKLLKENEKSANLAAAKVMRITEIVFTVILILNILKIFIVDMQQMVIAYITGSILLLIPTLIVNGIKKAEAKHTKYIIVSCAVIFISILTVIMPKHSILMYVFPIAISSLYFSGRLSVFSMIFTIIAVSVSQLISFYVPSDPDANFTDLKGVVLFAILPRAMILFALSMIFIMLCKRTTSLLGNLMSAEQQELIREKSAEISQTLVKAVSEIDAISEQSAVSGKTAAREAEKVMRDSRDNSECIRMVEDNMNTISDDLQQLDNMSREIEDSIKSSNEITAENNSYLSTAESGMKEIYQHTDESMKIIDELSSQSKRIAEAVKIIEDISQQTDILAINARIEAAHAGEAGKGFSIVSEEISSLSAKTKSSAKEIGDIAKRFTYDINNAVFSMERNFTLTREGMENMEKIKNSADRINSTNSEISGNIAYIANVISNVARSSGEINSRLSEVSENIENNYTAVSSVSESIRSNSERVVTLSSMVKNIKDMSEQLSTLAK